MHEQLNEETNTRYRDMAEGKTPQPQHTDILWITPKRLACLFGVMLVVTLMFNGV
uniref:Uncharacterized protein n=1 Tax=Pseudomonas phage RVTF4 TaxID=3236931 RepID=A0AB39CCW5_9VIRU